MRDAHTLINGYFDDTLTPGEHSALSDWIKAAPENARQFARAAMMHDRLRDCITVEIVGDSATKPTRQTATTYWLHGKCRTAMSWNTAASIAAVLVGLTVLWFSFGPLPASAAYRELDRIIVSSTHSSDRTYSIKVEDVSTFDAQSKNSMREELKRPPKPSLDGATLFLRDSDQFVLIRNTAEGIPFVTGSDGQRSWAVNTRGPVRLSLDIHHFDHDVPGHETAIPLTNLHEGLERLKRAYSLQFSTLGPEEYETPTGEVVRMLVAIKKPKERGPQRVEIAYEANCGRIRHMRFVQMPYGPDRLDLRMTLIDEKQLPSDFFDHTSHHTAERTVEMEN